MALVEPSLNPLNEPIFVHFLFVKPLSRGFFPPVSLIEAILAGIVQSGSRVRKDKHYGHTKDQW